MFASLRVKLKSVKDGREHHLIHVGSPKEVQVLVVRDFLRNSVSWELVHHDLDVDETV